MIELPEPLPWHALNYRTAHTVDAEAMWQELAEAIREYGNACARAAMARDAQICDAIETRHYERMRQRDSHSVQYIEGKSDGAGECVRAIRAEIEKEEAK